MIESLGPDELVRMSDDEIKDRIADLVFEYRQYKITADSIMDSIKEVKQELEPLVREVGKWEDADGYAQVIERNPTVSYKSAEVEKLVKAWSKSDDAMLKSAAVMLSQHRKEKDGYSYIRVK